jgi:DeoR/GlpR family transcriptional regulator of sugar metabolism
VTVDGVSPACGFTVLDDITAQIFQPLIDKANAVYICAASTKFGKNALSVLNVPQQTTTLVTDAGLSEAFRAHADAEGLRLICAPTDY